MEEGPGRLPGRYTSLESLHTNNVLVKKRHSNYSLAPSSTPPLPSMPSHHEFHPSRPPRNPARSNIPSTTTIPTLLSSSASSASIASSSQPLAPRKQRSSPITSNPYSKRPSTADSVFAPSFASRTSAISAASNLSSPSTAGSRDRDKNKEKVTPWEFQDLIQATERELAVPAHLVDVTLGGIATTSTTAAVGAAVSPDIGVGKKLTGRVEEVTPWEMHDPPSPALSDFSSSSHPNVSGRARSSTNTSYGSNASASTSSSTGKSVGKSPSTSSSSHKSAGSGLITPTPYAMRFSSAQTEMREVRDHTASFSLSPSASASTSTLGSVGSIIHRPQDHPHLPPSSGDIIYGDRHTDVAGPSTGISISPPLPIPTPSLKPAPSMISLKSSLLPPPATTSTKHVPTPLPLRAAASTASVAPSIASAKSTLSTTSMSSKELTSPTSVGGGSASTGTVEDVTPWELYPPPPVLPPPVASPAPPPLPPMPPTPGGKEKKRRSSVSMSLEERRKSASGGVAGALSSMGLGLGKIKTRERDKDKDRDKDRERERTGSVTGHAPPLPSSSGMLHQSSQSLLRPEKDREARVATGLTEDVAPWELEDVVPNPRWVVETQDSENAQYVEIVERKKSASGTPTPISLSAGGDDAGASTMRARGSMTLEQMAEVMPWELYPIPVEVGKTVPTTAGAFPPPVEGGMSSEKSSQKNYQTHQQRYEASLQQPPRQSNAVASSSTSAFSEFGLKRRKSAGGTSGKTKNVSEKERDREAIVAVSNALAGSTPLPGSSSSSSSAQQTSSRELRERSRLSGLVGISSNDVILNGLPSYPSSSTPISPIASSSGHFGTGISSSSSSTAHVNHGSISATSSSALNNPSGIIIGNSNNINSNNGSNNITRLNGRSSPKSTAAHRTMIEGLRASIKAREAQYVVKGVGHIVPGGGRSEGKKHHPYLREVVPYPRSYEREVVDLDIWETQFCMDLCDSVTWHVFETPPTKVLDLGCGSGTWILHCAKNWKDCHFVGLDIVPLHPDLQVVGSADLASRITWVQHNFLERLPFQDEEFDYVHIKRIALGVPEDKWDFLLDELARVMKPGAALELIEEDLFFPGIKKDTSDDTEATDDASSTTRRNSVSSDQQSADKHSLVSDSGRPATPTSSSHTLSGHVPSQPLTPTPDHAQLSRFDMGGEDLAGLSRYASSSSTNLITPHSRSTARPPLTVKTQKGSGQTYSDMTANQSIYGANVGVLGGMGYMASEDPLMALIKEQKMQRAAAAATTPVPSKGPTPSKSRVDPHGRSGAKMVTDPRDHTMLEAIWNGMLEARFVNRTPLSMLTTYMEYHFTDVRTHPPLMYCFPISHPTEYWDSDPDSDSDSDSDEDDEEEPPSTPHQAPSEPDVDEARDAIVPRPHSIKSTQSLQTSSGSDIPSAQQREWSVFDEESPWVDLQRRLEICYPFITLDGSRVWSKFSPHSGATLPNTILKIDIKSLNQHLALRAKEVIASSESMWEWVLERQAAAEKDAAQGVRNRSGSASIETYMVGVPSSSASNSSLDLTQNAILEMTRDDFNHLMNNFHLDMEDKASLGHATQERFNWHVFKSHVTQDRKAFNKACRKYDRWVARKIRRAKRMATNPYRQTINHQSRNSMSASAPGLVLPASELGVPVDYNIIARSSSTPQPSTGDHRPDDVSSIATAVNSRQDIKSSQTQFQTPPALPTFSLSQLPPEQRYSRALRVFVAWKAS